MDKRHNYKVMAIATLCKNFDIKAENEEEAKRAVRTLLREDGGEPFTEDNLISENFAVALLPETKEEEPEQFVIQRHLIHMQLVQKHRVMADDKSVLTII